MTTGPTDTPDPEATEKLLASMAEQVAQQSRTTALHISQHDDIEAAAQERANAVIEGIRADLEAAYQAALARATEAMTASQRGELHQNLTAMAERFNETLQELTDHHAGILRGHVEALEELGKTERRAPRPGGGGTQVGDRELAGASPAAAAGNG